MSDVVEITDLMHSLIRSFTEAIEEQARLNLDMADTLEDLESHRNRADTLEAENEALHRRIESLEAP